MFSSSPMRMVSPSITTSGQAMHCGQSETTVFSTMAHPLPGGTFNVRTDDGETSGRGLPRGQDAPHAGQHALKVGGLLFQ